MNAAKRKSTKYTFVEYTVVDIEATPAENLIDSFDCIISTNCVHATKDLYTSMTHIRQMLHEDGFVALVEFTKNMRWFDVIFGILDGWWLFQDGRRHVLVNESFWEQSFRRAGFQHIDMTNAASLEAQTLRIIAGWPSKPHHGPTQQMKTGCSRHDHHMETLVYKIAEENLLRADISYPADAETCQFARPVGMKTFLTLAHSLFSFALNLSKRW